MALRITAFLFVLLGGVAVSAALHVRQSDENFTSRWHPGLLPAEWELGLPYAILALGIAASAPGPSERFRYHWAILFGLAGAFVAWAASEFFPRDIRFIWLRFWSLELGPERNNSETVLFGVMSWLCFFTVPLWGLLWALDWLNVTHRQGPRGTIGSASRERQRPEETRR